MKKLVSIALVVLSFSICLAALSGCNPFAPGQVKKEARKN